MKTKENNTVITEEKREEHYASVKNLIWSIIHQFNNITQEDKEDIFQEASCHLVNNITERYDSSRNVEFKDFAYTCIRNFVLRKVNQIIRKNKIIIPNDDLFNLEVEEPVVDCKVYHGRTKIEKLKQLVYSDSPLLKEKEKVVLKMIIENPSITQKEIAIKMGFSYASGAGAILSRFRARMKSGKIFDEME